MVVKNRLCESKAVLSSVGTLDKCASTVEENRELCASGGGYFGFMSTKSQKSCQCCTNVDEALSNSVDVDDMNMYLIRGKTYSDSQNGGKVTWSAFKNYCADNENNGV